MKEPKFPQRKQIRIKEYDYSQQGYYFITICTINRKQILSKIINKTPKNKTHNGQIANVVGADDPVRPYKRLYKDLNLLQQENVLNIIIIKSGNVTITNTLLEMKRNIIKY